MNTIAEQLWDYIDGNLDESQAKAIEEKIKSDATVRFQYEEILSLNAAFGTMDLDEPSMSFTRNIMEQVDLLPAPVSLKTRVDKKIIYCIGSFFIISLVAVFGYAIDNANLKMSDFNLNTHFNFQFDQYFTPTAVYCFLFADLVIGLIFLDQFLRKKMMKGR